MNLTQFSIERNRVSLALLAVVIVMGLTLYQGLSRDSMPPYTVRVANIISNFPGAGPERVELLVTDKIEKKAQEIPEVKTINSTSRTGLSVVTVELKFEVGPEDLQDVWDELRRKLDEIEDLPEGVVPNLNDSDVGVVYGIIVGLLSDGFSYAETEEYADDIRDAFIKLDDAAKVELGGVQEERVFVEYNNAQLAEYGITSSQLQNIIASTNIINSGGEINLQEERIILEPTGNFNEMEDLKRTMIPVGQGEVLYLEDITDVNKGYISPSKTKVLVNGKPAIALAISLKEGANIVKLGQEVDRLVEQWNNELPVGLELFRLASMDGFVQESIDNFVGNLMQSIVIVLLVMLVFLGFRTGIVVASLIPFVTIMTLMIMGLLDIGLNQVTLAALIMALGMMVDNAIVVSESIMVKMGQGIDSKKAAIDSCSELAIPLLISTLTTSAAFLSFYLAQAKMGDIVGPIFVVITIALLCSWVLSLTIITLLAYLFIKVKKIDPGVQEKLKGIDKAIETLKQQYQKLLINFLRIKGLFIAGVLGLFVLSIFGFGLLPFIFMPDSERNLVTVDINLPLGTKIESTEGLIQKIEGFIVNQLLVTSDGDRGIKDWSSFIGQGPESYDLGYEQEEPNSSYAHMLLNTTSGDDNQYVIETLDDFCFKELSEADIKIKRLAQGGSSTPIEIRISGTNPELLMEIGEQTKTQLDAISGTKNVKDDWGPKIKKFVIDIDQNKAQRAGITNQDIAISLKTVLSGFRTGEFREDDKSIPILMRGENSEQQTLASLETMNIYAQNSGQNVPLIQVAKVVPQWQFAKILRYDILRTITIECQLKEGAYSSEIMAEMIPWLDEQRNSWPSNYFYELGGDDEDTAENMGSVIAFIPLSGFIILILLIIQFNSLRKTFMVVSTIPLGVIGVVIGLILFRSYFGFFGFLGTISLAGIVINNAIVLIDRIEIELNEFKRIPQDAVITAALQRFRPIILTTFTTSLGLVPLYLGGGIMWEPLAVAIMIGLLFATIITLLFIPVLYSILYKVDFSNYDYRKIQSVDQ